VHRDCLGRIAQTQTNQLTINGIHIVLQVARLVIVYERQVVHVIVIIDNLAHNGIVGYIQHLHNDVAVLVYSIVELGETDDDALALAVEANLALVRVCNDAVSIHARQQVIGIRIRITAQGKDIDIGTIEHLGNLSVGLVARMLDVGKDVARTVHLDRKRVECDSVVRVAIVKEHWLLELKLDQLAVPVVELVDKLMLH